MYHHFLRGPVRAPSSAALLDDQLSECDRLEYKQFRLSLPLCRIQNSKGLLRKRPTAVAGSKTNDGKW